MWTETIARVQYGTLSFEHCRSAHTVMLPPFRVAGGQDDEFRTCLNLYRVITTGLPATTWCDRCSIPTIPWTADDSSISP